MKHMLGFWKRLREGPRYCQKFSVLTMACGRWYFLLSLASWCHSPHLEPYIFVSRSVSSSAVGCPNLCQSLKCGWNFKTVHCVLLDFKGLYEWYGGEEERAILHKARSSLRNVLWGEKNGSMSQRVSGKAKKCQHNDKLRNLSDFSQCHQYAKLGLVDMLLSRTIWNCYH